MSSVSLVEEEASERLEAPRVRGVAGREGSKEKAPGGSRVVEGLADDVCEFEEDANKELNDDGRGVSVVVLVDNGECGGTVDSDDDDAARSTLSSES